MLGKVFVLWSNCAMGGPVHNFEICIPKNECGEGCRFGPDNDDRILWNDANSFASCYAIDTIGRCFHPTAFLFSGYKCRCQCVRDCENPGFDDSVQVTIDFFNLTWNGCTEIETLRPQSEDITQSLIFNVASAIIGAIPNPLVSLPAGVVWATWNPISGNTAELGNNIIDALENTAQTLTNCITQSINQLEVDIRISDVRGLKSSYESVKNRSPDITDETRSQLLLILFATIQRSIEEIFGNTQTNRENEFFQALFPVYVSLFNLYSNVAAERIRYWQLKLASNTATTSEAINGVNYIKSEAEKDFNKFINWMHFAETSMRVYFETKSTGCRDQDKLFSEAHIQSHEVINKYIHPVVKLRTFFRMMSSTGTQSTTVCDSLRNWNNNVEKKSFQRWYDESRINHWYTADGDGFVPQNRDDYVYEADIGYAYNDEIRGGITSGTDEEILLNEPTIKVYGLYRKASNHYFLTNNIRDRALDHGYIFVNVFFFARYHCDGLTTPLNRYYRFPYVNGHGLESEDYTITPYWDQGAIDIGYESQGILAYIATSQTDPAPSLVSVSNFFVAASKIKKKQKTSIHKQHVTCPNHN